MTTIQMHPSELAYAFSYSKTEEVIGWGHSPFEPAETDQASLAQWFADGAARLTEAGRLVGDPDEGLDFTEEAASNILALADPVLVLLAERKAGEGMQRFSVHAAKDDYVGMTRRPDGTFELTRYADLVAAASATSAFVGAARARPTTQSRIKANHKVWAKVVEFARAGRTDEVTAGLMRLGAGRQDAVSATAALASPATSGMVSVLYCANNQVQDAEPISVMTNAEGDTWIVFPPGSLDGPMILERSSIAALAARISVGVAARMAKPA